MEGGVKELSLYRYECSVEALEDARLMLQNGRYKNALNRAYYAIFHAVRAVNVLQKFDSGKHSGVIAFFNLNYVKTGIFSKEASKIIKEASEKREHADYLDFFVASKEQAEKQIARATQFQMWIEEYLNKEGVINSNEKK